MQVVVITGASAGAGRATARRFARDGARIGLIARDEARLKRTAQEVEQLGGRALALPLDVADADAVEQAAERVEAELGPIDIWINSAMVTIFAPVAEMTPQEVRRVTEVTYLGYVYGTMAALKRMRPRDGGTIVQAGSALAYRSIPLQAAYCGAKHAIVGFTDALRCELIHDRSNVAVTVVHLPALNTPQFEWARNKMPQRPQPVPPIFQPEVAAEALHFAARHPRRELWVGRSSVMAILAQRLFPGLLDRYLAYAAYNGQQDEEPALHGPDNLFEPVKGDFAAHGRFDDRASAVSPQLWAAEHRGPLAGAALMLALGGLGWWAGRALLRGSDERTSRRRGRLDRTPGAGRRLPPSHLSRMRPTGS
ncbi:MAG TPA: SDR family oxidoreductase [Afifellaceae bacterium]|nr:SDR family oxidoreductase [Afifellaceae bacterium]